MAEGETYPGFGPDRLANLLSHHSPAHTHMELFAAKHATFSYAAYFCISCFLCLKCPSSPYSKVPSAWETPVHPAKLSSTYSLKAFCCSPPSCPSSLNPNTHLGTGLMLNCNEAFSSLPVTPGVKAERILPTQKVLWVCQ